MLNGLKHGDNCEFYFADGDKYLGSFENDEFKNGTFEGKGMQYKGDYLNF